MNRKTRSLILKTLITAAIVVAVPLAFSPGNAFAATVYLGDGAKQNVNGGWDLPKQGTCPAGTAQGYTGIDTRPECVALRLNLVQASCVAPTYSWTTGGVCNDPVNTTQAACETATDRLWNPGTGICSIVMQGDDRNNLVCMQHGGTYSTVGTCTGAGSCLIAPTLPTGPRGCSPRIHPPAAVRAPATSACDATMRTPQYNGPRVRDAENTLYQGHKNMARKVAPTSPVVDLLATHGYPWGGPPFSCTSPLYEDEQNCEANGFHWNPTIYPSDDSGNVFDWPNGQATVGGNARDVAWIYGDWLAPLPRGIYKTTASTSQVCSDPRGTTANCVSTYGGTLINNAGASYSCGRCHTTGWTSDSSIQATKEPEKSFPGITWDRNSNAGFGVVNLSGGVLNDSNKYSSWDVWGISCNRCHNAVVDPALVTCYGFASSGACTTAGGVWSSRDSTCGSLPAAACSGGGLTILGGSAPVGMSSHHNNLTAPDSGGVCTDVRFTAIAQCNAAGAQAAWLTNCSVAGTCLNTAYTTSGACVAGGSTWTPITTSGACTTAGGTWNATTKLQRRRVLQQGNLQQSVLPECHRLRIATVETWTGYATTGRSATAVVAANSPAATDIVRCDRCRWQVDRQQHEPRPDHHPPLHGLPPAGDERHAVRQRVGHGRRLLDLESRQLLKVGPAHGTVAPVSHPHANMFLNSPHARFTGTFNQVATAKNGSGYGSFFMNDGEAANTGNGCTGCHDVHESIVEDSSPFPAIKEECTECHAGQYAMPLEQMLHPMGPGTPAENMATEPAEACEICHMPEAQHFFRINPSAVYSTYPASALSTTVNANTEPETTRTR